MLFNEVNATAVTTADFLMRVARFVATTTTAMMGTVEAVEQMLAMHSSVVIATEEIPANFPILLKVTATTGVVEEVDSRTEVEEALVTETVAVEYALHFKRENVTEVVAVDFPTK